MSGYSHILLAVDFNQHTTQIAQRALQLQNTFGAKLSLIHVVEFVQIDLSNDLVMPQELELDQELVELAEKRLNELAEQLNIKEYTCLVSQGNTKREILRVAEEQGIDLIVIGSHGRSGIQLLLGSTANAVLHGAPCDVLAVRIKESESA